jgi:uncharacterized ubiquitin-like protein YukD
MERKVYIQINKEAYEIPLEEQLPLKYLIPHLIQKLKLNQQQFGQPAKYTLSRVIAPDETLQQVGVRDGTLLKLQINELQDPVGEPKPMKRDQLPDHSVSG